VRWTPTQAAEGGGYPASAVIGAEHNIRSLARILCSDAFECLYPRLEDRDLLFFVANMRRSDAWAARPVDADGSTATPLFSQRAWDALRPLIGAEVEALPSLHPRGAHYAINVLDVADCLGLTHTKLTRNDVTCTCRTTPTTT
jgi:hypothetical protein